MLQAAIDDFDIDISKSFFVGDTTGDILAGQRMGLKTILVKTGHAGLDGRYEVKADLVADDLAAALVYIP